VSGALPPVCILAGGLGTRLGERVRTTPKPLLEVAGEPFLLHQLRLLAAHGARRAIICVGYRGELIVETIGPARFGIEIAYSYDGPEPIGTLGAVRKAAALLGERFLILYGDTYLRVDYSLVADAWARSASPAMMTVLRNTNRWDRSNVEFDGERILSYDKIRPSERMQWIDYGLGGLQRDAIDAAGDRVDDLAELYHVLASRGELFGYAATNRFYEIGTPASLAETSTFLKSLRTDGT
jgi:N-acetyl-alpha-D-muramate 1-phosphate uridylyltransferase